MERKTRKKNCCLFCRNNFSNIAHHLQVKHGDENEVAKFVILPKGSKERRQIIDLLRKKGNYEGYKYENILIPVRLPQEGKRPRLIPCPRCRGYYSKSSLRKHYPNCQHEGHTYRNIDRTLIILGRRLNNDIHCTATKELVTVMSRLRMDKIYDVIRVDPLIISFGNKLCKKLKSPHHAKEIRAHLRHLGRFLYIIKNLNSEISELATIYDPKYYNICLTAVETMSKILPDAGNYQCPVVALSMGTLLKKIGKHAKSYFIQNKLEYKTESWKKFMHLLNEDYGTAVNKTAVENLSQMHRNKTVHLPTVDDISKLYSFLCDKRNFYVKEITETGFSYKVWKELSSYTLTSIQIFNRRRPGESERMLISDLENTKKADYTEDRMLFNSLNITEQEAAREYCLITLRGKLNRSVSMLVDQRSLKCLHLIVKHRDEAGVHKKNPYVFGLPGEDKHEFRHLDACALMRRFSSSCNLSHPETLRATLLRKHIATYCAAMGYNDEEIVDVANHLGHEEKIHKEYYRMPVITKEITQMSKLLQQSLLSRTEEETFSSIVSPKPSTSSNISPEIDETSYEIVTEFPEDTALENTLAVEDYSEDIITQERMLYTEYSLETHTNALNEEFLENTAFENISTTEEYSENITIQGNSTSCTNSSPEVDTSVTNEDVLDHERNNVLFEDEEKVGNSSKGKELQIIIVPLELEQGNRHKISKEANRKGETSKYKLSESENSECESDICGTVHNKTKNKTKGGTKKRIRKTWTTPEKATVRNVFKRCFKNKILPSLEECQKAIDAYSDLKKQNTTTNSNLDKMASFEKQRTNKI